MIEVIKRKWYFEGHFITPSLYSKKHIVVVQPNPEGFWTEYIHGRLDKYTLEIAHSDLYKSESGSSTVTIFVVEDEVFNFLEKLFAEEYKK